MKQNPLSGKQHAPTAAVVSSSPLFRRRIAQPLDLAGYNVVEVGGAKKFLRSRRQRPYIVCFFDVRGPMGFDALQRCFTKRPGERYVLIREAWTADGSNQLSSECQEFGRLPETFANEEILDWALRASTEERLSEGVQPLEELLYERFCAFLHQLGPAPMHNLHDLVWERVERPLFKAVLERTGGNQSHAADMLGIHRNTLRTKLKSLGLR